MMSISGLGLGFRMRLGKRRKRCKYRGFRAVTDISVLRPAYAAVSHACLEAGAADAHDARPGGGQGCALGDPGGEHRQHQRLAGGGGKGVLLWELPCLCLLLLVALPAPGRSPLEYFL